MKKIYTFALGVFAITTSLHATTYTEPTELGYPPLSGSPTFQVGDVLNGTLDPTVSDKFQLETAAPTLSTYPGLVNYLFDMEYVNPHGDYTAVAASLYDTPAGNSLLVEIGHNNLWGTPAKYIGSFTSFVTTPGEKLLWDFSAINWGRNSVQQDYKISYTTENRSVTDIGTLPTNYTSELTFNYGETHILKFEVPNERTFHAAESSADTSVYTSLYLFDSTGAVVKGAFGYQQDDGSNLPDFSVTIPSGTYYLVWSEDYLYVDYDLVTGTSLGWSRKGFGQVKSYWSDTSTVTLTISDTKSNKRMAPLSELKLPPPLEKLKKQVTPKLARK
jgi:hypothetical protein